MVRAFVLLALIVARFDLRASPSNLPPAPRLADGCTFVVGTISVSEEGLFLRCGKTEFRIFHPKNLQGLVKISTGDEALRFVRFFTSRKTFFLVGLQGDVEVVPAGQVSNSFFYSARKQSAALTPVAVEEFDDPTEGRVFIIQRTVVGMDQALYRLRERVAESGNYDLQARKLIERDASRLGIVHIGEH